MSNKMVCLTGLDIPGNTQNKANQRRHLKKMSNGCGLFYTFYYLTTRGVGVMGRLGGRWGGGKQSHHLGALLGRSGGDGGGRKSTCFVFASIFYIVLCFLNLWGAKRGFWTPPPLWLFCMIFSSNTSMKYTLHCPVHCLLNLKDIGSLPTILAPRLWSFGPLLLCD